jgi:hypothetical protein
MTLSLLPADVLAEVRDLPPAQSGVGLAVGLMLWFAGARGHRFWLALAITVTGGLAGLRYGPDFGLQPLVGGLLVAVSAGALALALARVVLFAAGGVAALALVQELLPAWKEQPLVFFLTGGLVGIVFYRLWVTALTSFAGAVLIAYCTLALVGKLGKVDILALADKNGPALSGAVIALTLLGVPTQFILEKRRQRKRKEREDARKREEERRRQIPARQRTLLARILWPSAKKAG